MKYTFFRFIILVAVVILISYFHIAESSQVQRVQNVQNVQRVQNVQKEKNTAILQSTETDNRKSTNSFSIKSRRFLKENRIKMITVSIVIALILMVLGYFFIVKKNNFAKSDTTLNDTTSKSDTTLKDTTLKDTKLKDTKLDTTSKDTTSKVTQVEDIIVSDETKAAMTDRLTSKINGKINAKLPENIRYDRLQKRIFLMNAAATAAAAEERIYTYSDQRIDFLADFLADDIIDKMTNDIAI